MRLHVAVRADESLLGCDIWLLTEDTTQPPALRQANHVRGCKREREEKKGVEDTEGPGYV